MFKSLSIGRIGITATQRDVIELALSYRLKGMDLDIVEFASQVEQYGLGDARRLIDSAQIRIGCFRLPFAIGSGVEDSVFAASLSKLSRLAELAAELDCTRCVVTIESSSDFQNYQDNFDLHRRRLREVAAVLTEHNIRLGLEFTAASCEASPGACPFVQSFDALLMLAKSTMQSNIGVVVDLFEIYAGGGSLDQLSVLTASDVVAVAVADIAESSDPTSLQAANRTLPGVSGQIDTSAALTLLDGLGYDGPVMPSASRESFDVQGRGDKVKHAGEQLDEAWGVAGLSVKGKVAASI